MYKFRMHIRQLKERQRHNLSLFAAIGFAFALLILLALGINALGICGRF